MYLDVSKKVLQGTYITDGEVRIQESFVSSLGSLSSVAYLPVDFPHSLTHASQCPTRS